MASRTTAAAKTPKKSPAKPRSARSKNGHDSSKIIVRGAREHNLKNVDVEMPRDKLVVFTGLSGSGKSSLAFATIYAEGQRRYVESLSAYARQFLGQMDKPDVDVIEGLSPAISIDQKSASRNPRSTVGTITEVYDYLRLLYARIGIQHCPNDGTPLQRQTPQQIVDRILEMEVGLRFQVLAPVVRGRKGEYDTLLQDLSGQGYVRAVVDGLVGMSAGDEKEVTMEFPEDFKPGALAGKTAIYSVKAEEVREKVLPELDEELLKSLGVEDEEGLRKAIGENIENQKKQQNANAERQQVTEALLKAVDFPIPESGVASETDAVLREFMQRNMQQGISVEELEKHKEQLHEGASKAARDRLKSRLILSKIAEKEKIKAEQDDFSRMIMMQAQQSGEKPEKLVKELQKDQNRIKGMRSEIILGKAMDLLLEKAERSTVEPEAAGSEK
jgi:ABC-type dipeptide/oligopeptide/nickel transport system ATPase component